MISTVLHFTSDSTAQTASIQGCGVWRPSLRQSFLLLTATPQKLPNAKLRSFFSLFLPFAHCQTLHVSQHWKTTQWNNEKKSSKNSPLWISKPMILMMKTLIRQLKIRLDYFLFRLNVTLTDTHIRPCNALHSTKPTSGTRYYFCQEWRFISHQPYLAY